MKILFAGATGATGRILLNELLNREHKVKAIIRSEHKLPESIKTHQNLTLIKQPVLDINEREMAEIARDCDAVVSCLGHNLNFSGVFGAPRMLVTDAAMLFCNSIRAIKPASPIKFILMNTAGNSNRDIDEPVSFWQRLIISVIRHALPPHKDNEKASDYLRQEIGQDNEYVEWCVVRPDSLVNGDKESEYDVHKSPTRSAIFNPGKTSRINVAHFMTRLISDDRIWNIWKGKMPVIYNK